MPIVVRNIDFSLFAITCTSLANVCALLNLLRSNVKCFCKTTSESFCKLNDCDLVGGSCCQNFTFCSVMEVCNCFSNNCDSDQCCDKEYELCSGLCPTPTINLSSQPSIHPSISNTSTLPSNNPSVTLNDASSENLSDIPSKDPSDVLSKKPSAV